MTPDELTEEEAADLRESLRQSAEGRSHWRDRDMEILMAEADLPGTLDCLPD